MKLKELINRIYLGTAIDERHLKKEELDYFYLIPASINNGIIVKDDSAKYIRKSIVEKHHAVITNDFLEYGDYLIYKENNDFQIYRYQNEIKIPVLPGLEFIIIKSNVSYLEKFLRDTQGLSYFKEQLKELYNKYRDDYSDFYKRIPEIEFEVTSNLVVKETFENVEIDSSKHELKKQPLNPADIKFTTDSISIYSLMKRISRNAINLYTDFQRLQNLWSDEAQSRLIESLLVKFPIPAFYFDCSKDDNWLVIDGLQRISTINKFYNDGFELKKLEFLPDLEGKVFSQLSPALQGRIEETNVTALKLLAGTPIRVKYSLFERINTEGKPLKPQELRHAVNSFSGGKPSKYIEKLSQIKIFKEIWGMRPKDRMQDRETVLRYVAFRLNSYEEYGNSMKDFLDSSMSKIYKTSDFTLDKIEKEFGDSLVLCNQLFGESAFKISDSKNKKTLFNYPLFEIFTTAFAKIDSKERNIIWRSKRNFSKIFNDAIEIDEFNEIIRDSKKANTYDGVQKRFKAIDEIIRINIQR